MGNFLSKAKPAVASAAASSALSSSKSRDDDNEKQQQQLQLHGVLVPPKFGITAPSTSPAMRDRLPAEPSLWALLHKTDTSYCILHDYMYPGLHIAGQDDDLGRFRAAFTDNTNNSSSEDAMGRRGTYYNNNNKYAGRIFLERLGHSSLLQLRYGTQEVPNMSVGLHVAHGCAVFAHLTTTGYAWAGTLVDKTFEVPSSLPLFRDMDDDDDDSFSRIANLKVGTWLDGRMRVIDNVPLQDSIYLKAEELHGYAALTMLGTVCAMEAKLPLATLELSTKSHFSMDIGKGLPLRLAMERTENKSMLSLSQLFSFDRYQLNPVEDRAPRVLNRMGWTIRMVHHDEAGGGTAGGSTSSSASDEAGSTSVALGGAWQINRALALKAVLRPTESSNYGNTNHDGFLTTAVILKRWQQPRTTASFLFRHSLHAPLSPRFLGIGLEIETGNLPEEEQFFQDDSKSHVSRKKHTPPPTRAIFEDDV